MHIRKAKVDELSDILAIYERASTFMKETGNPTHWAGGYPASALLQADIAGGHLYVIEDGEILHGVFAFFPEGDLIYDTLPVIWQNTLPHGAIHRVASAGTARGVLRTCVEFCLSVCDNLKIDTHKDNIVMQNALARLGFARCGVAEIPDVGERIVFQLCKKEQV